MHDDAIFAARALEAGAHGYLTKMARPEELITAIGRIKDGEIYLEHAVATKLAMINAGRSDSLLKNLTVRDLQVLGLIGKGKRHGEIADELNISYKTVANTCSQLKAKLGVRSISDLIRIAIENETTIENRPCRRS